MTTNTPDNESYGAKVLLINGGGRHVYTGYADKDGDVVIPNVWKATYSVTISLDGFNVIDTVALVDKNTEYNFSYQLIEQKIQPYNLMIEDGEKGNVRDLIWNYANYFEDGFEDDEDFSINPVGKLGWQYIDGDGAETGGLSDYIWENEYSPMAFIAYNASKVDVGNGYNIGDYYSALKPHGGNECLQDWAAYNVPNDDWLITPKLHFQKAIEFRFYARNFAYGYPEELEILYSKTGTSPSDFIRLDSITVNAYDWNLYKYDIPQGAKYVALHCVSNQKRVLSLDDISFGLPDALPDAANYISIQKVAARHVPTADGAYDVYLDGKLVTKTNETEYEFTDLAVGKHTAGVVASYTSAKTDMSTIDFEISATDDIASVTGNVKLSVVNRILTIDGSYNHVAVYDTSGKLQPIRMLSHGVYSMSEIPVGVYVVNVNDGNKMKTMKIVLK